MIPSNFFARLLVIATAAATAGCAVHQDAAPSLVEILRGDRAAIAACAYLKLDARAQGAVKLVELPGLKASRLLSEVEAHGLLGRANFRDVDVMLFSDGPNTRVEVRSLSDFGATRFVDAIRGCALQA